MPDLQMSKIKFKTAKQFATAHPNTGWWSQDLRPGRFTPGTIPKHFKELAFQYLKHRYIPANWKWNAKNA